MQPRPARLVLLCGLPGAGKSTLARALVASLPGVTFSPDDWSADLDVDVHDEGFRYRLEQRFCVLAWELLAVGVNVVLEFGCGGTTNGSCCAAAHGIAGTRSSCASSTCRSRSCGGGSRPETARTQRPLAWSAWAGSAGTVHDECGRPGGQDNRRSRARVGTGWTWLRPRCFAS